MPTQRSMPVVLNVNHLLDPVSGGGTAERTFQMSRFLAKAGIDCRVLTTDLGLTAERRARLNGVTITAAACLSKRFFVPRLSPAVIRVLVRQADVVHLMGHWTVLNALVYWAARAAKKPYVVCPAGALPLYGRSRWLKKLYNALIGRAIIANAAAWIAVTPDEAMQFAEYGVDAGQITVLPNGVDPDDFSAGDVATFRDRHGLGDAPLLLFMGRLNTIKGPDLLLQAFARIAPCFLEHHLVLAGPDGGLLDQLRTDIDSLGISGRVHFTGYLGGADKAGAYAAAELLAIPSRQEAMSIVVLEAGACGTPVLLTDRCGFDDVARIAGGAVVPATVEGIAEGLEALLLDRASLPEKGRNLHRYVTERFTWELLVERYLHLYRSLLEQP